MTICRWCQRKSPLVKSHVIATGLFSDLIENGRPLAIAGSNSRVEKSYTGIWSRFVCTHCEAKFKKFDDCLINLRRRLREATPVYEGEALLFKDLDGGEVAKAVLSVLYRAHLSDHKLFASVQLGPYEKILADHLDTSVVGCPKDTSVILHVNSGLSSTVVLNPVRRRWAGVNGYKLYFPNLIALIRLDHRKFPPPLPEVELGSDRATICLFGSRWELDNIDRVRTVLKKHETGLSQFFERSGRGV